MNKVKEDVENVIGRVLEEWGLMMIERPEGGGSFDLFDQAQEFRMAELDFRGIVSGTCYVICQDNFARCITANLLGTFDDPAEEDVQDAIRELINVAAGNMLTSSWGDDCVFKLTPPQMMTLVPSKAEELLMRHPFYFLADDHPVAFGFSVKRSLENDSGER